ncbi:MAG: SGNH/GDSL hydrolase family protein [Verrucomicrobiota bacterium]
MNLNFSRLSLSLLVIALPAISFAQPSNGPVLQWRGAQQLAIEGKGWNDTKEFFDRLPARAETIVRPAVWNLSRDSAGICVRFTTDATAISVRWKLRKESLSMPHMAASGVSGVDLYVKEKKHWHWLAAGRPDKTNVNEKIIVKDLTSKEREYILYFPLYNGLLDLEIGVPMDAKMVAAPVRKQKPIVFYGTSILQGACASRPGMAYPAILGRRLDWPTINLGFSGNGKSEPEMANLIAELDAAVFVLDSLPNLPPEQVSERVEPFIKILRAAHPTTPIVLVEHIKYPDGILVEPRRRKYEEGNPQLRKIFRRLVKSGDKNLHYISAKKLIGNDGEATVDGTHPTDLGFLRMADAMVPTLANLLRR